jgi:hypothetical protein
MGHGADRTSGASDRISGSEAAETARRNAALRFRSPRQVEEAALSTTLKALLDSGPLSQLAIDMGCVRHWIALHPLATVRRLERELNAWLDHSRAINRPALPITVADVLAYLDRARADNQPSAVVLRQIASLSEVNRLLALEDVIKEGVIRQRLRQLRREQRHVKPTSQGW